MARQLAVEHKESTISDHISDEMGRIAWFADEPFADTSLLPMYELARLARRSVTVCLSGDGGDELFGGYETYLADRLCQASRWLPRRVANAALNVIGLFPASRAKVGWQFKAKQFLHGHDPDLLKAHFAWRQLFSPSQQEELLRPEWCEAVLSARPLDDFRRFDAEVAGLDVVDRMGYVDVKTWMVDDILVKVDRATMAHGLEARAPFLDYRLVEFAASLPADMKVRGMVKKWILKRAMRGLVPSEVLDRRKRGFNAPIAHWLDAGQGLLRGLSATDLAGEWFRPKAVQALIDDHAARRADNSFKLLALICLALWVTNQSTSGCEVAA